jgi:hypothetical protein
MGDPDPFGRSVEGLGAGVVIGTRNMVLLVRPEF